MSIFSTKFLKRNIVGVLILIAVIAIGIHLYSHQNSPVNSLRNNISHVNVTSVAKLSFATSSLPVIATVTSLNQATVLAQIPGEIVSLPHSLGDNVSTGDIIAKFSNNTQQAAVLQAQGAYEAALAGLTNAQSISTRMSIISVKQSINNIQNAQNALSNALKNMYSMLDDAVHTKADQLFSNPRNSTIRIIITIPNERLALLILQERIQLQTTFNVIFPYTKDIASSTLSAHSTHIIAATNLVIQFLGNLATAVNETQSIHGTTSPILAGYASSIAAGRNEISAGLSGLIAAKSAYDNALSALQSANNTAINGIPNAIVLAKSHIKQALGAYNGARAILEKTIIRSPINGTIVSLPITLGDYVSMFSPVAIISNPHALYLKTFVSSNDAKTLTVGGHTIINNSLNGVITFIAPARDPLTNKIEIKIGITNSSNSLTDGEVVSVMLERLTSLTKNNMRTLSIPLTAIKMTPKGPEIFTVNNSNILVSTPIQIKSIVGNSVLLTSGAAPNTRIVTDARGLSNSQEVIVNKN